MATLASYLADTRRLLHDSSKRYWTDADLTAYINKARLRTVSDTTCNRQLQTLYLSYGVEQYVFGGVTGCTITNGGTGYTSAPTVTFAPPTSGTTATGTATVSGGAVVSITITSTGSGYTSAPLVTFTGGGGASAAATATIINPNTLDVMNIAVLWGNLRIVLNRMSFTEFQTTMRAWQAFYQRPTTWASYGQQAAFIGPIPDQMYVSEWDTLIKPTDLVNSTDVDNDIIDTYAAPVPFYAAYWAKFQEQAFDESKMFKDMYVGQVREVLRAVMMRKLPSAYGP